LGEDQPIEVEACLDLQVDAAAGGAISNGSGGRSAKTALRLRNRWNDCG